MKKADRLRTIAKNDATFDELRRALQDAAKHIVILEDALYRSLRLQSHYAELLNMHDGGKRIGFASVHAWLARLKELGQKPEVMIPPEPPEGQ